MSSYLKNSPNKIWGWVGVKFHEIEIKAKLAPASSPHFVNCVQNQGLTKLTTSLELNFDSINFPNSYDTKQLKTIVLKSEYCLGKDFISSFIL